MNRGSTISGIEHAAAVPSATHGISRGDISEAALRVVDDLRGAGFSAFVVGGCLRDLLLGLRPKDFDVATDARPEQVRRLFRRSRIIGRRFKIVHVRFGPEVIEVTTFRGHHETSNELGRVPTRAQSRELDSAHSHAGMTLIDNVYGTIDEDADRRDFTVNALYFDSGDGALLDFHAGLADLGRRRLRIIGDARERYREDPVRMLRAVRFAAKLDFTIDGGTAAPIRELGRMLESAAPPRLFDELLKLLCGGHAAATFGLLQEYGLDRVLFSHEMATAADARQPVDRLPSLALRNSDQRIARGLGITPGFLFAALLWPPLQQRLGKLDGKPNLMQLRECAEEVVQAQCGLTAIPRRVSGVSKEIWEMQQRLQRRDRRSANYCFEHPRFRAAYDFLLLREQSGEDTGGVGEWWTAFQEVDADERAQMLEQLSARPGKRRRRRRSRRAQSS